VQDDATSTAGTAVITAIAGPSFLAGSTVATDAAVAMPLGRMLLLELSSPLELPSPLEQLLSLSGDQMDGRHCLGDGSCWTAVPTEIEFFCPKKQKKIVATVDSTF